MPLEYNMSEKIIHKPKIKLLTDTLAVFEDGSEEEFDEIIHATGEKTMHYPNYDNLRLHSKDIITTFHFWMKNAPLE